MRDYNLNGKPYVVQGLHGDLPTSPSADNALDPTYQGYELEFEISMEWKGEIIVEPLEGRWHEERTQTMTGLTQSAYDHNGGYKANSKLACAILLQDWNIVNEIGHISSFDFKVEIDIDHPSWQKFKKINIFDNRPEVRVYIKKHGESRRDIFWLGFIMESKPDDDITNSFYPKLSCHCLSYDQLLSDDDLVVNWKENKTTLELINEAWVKKVVPAKQFGFPMCEVDPACTSIWEGGYQNDGSYIRFLEVMADRENAIWWFDHETKLHFWKKDTLRKDENRREQRLNGNNMTSPIKVGTDNYNYCNQVKFRCSNVKGELRTKTISAGGASADGTKELDLGTALHSVQSVKGTVNNNGKLVPIDLVKSDDPSHQSKSFFAVKDANINKQTISFSRDTDGTIIWVEYTTADHATHFMNIPFTKGTFEYPFHVAYDAITAVHVLTKVAEPRKWPEDGYQIDGSTLTLAKTYGSVYDIQATFTNDAGIKVSTPAIPMPNNPNSQLITMPMSSISSEWTPTVTDLELSWRPHGGDKWSTIPEVKDKFLGTNDGEWTEIKGTDRKDQLDTTVGSYKIDPDGKATFSGNMVGNITVTYYETLNQLITKTDQAEVTKERQFRTHGALWSKDITNDRIKTIEAVKLYIADYLAGHMKHNTTVCYTRYSGNDKLFDNSNQSQGWLMEFAALSYVYKLIRRYHVLDADGRSVEVMKDMPMDIDSTVAFFMQKITIKPYIHDTRLYLRSFQVDYELVDNQKDDWQNRIQRHEDQRVTDDQDGDGENAPIPINVDTSADIIGNKGGDIAGTAITADNTAENGELTTALKGSL